MVGSLGKGVSVSWPPGQRIQNETLGSDGVDDALEARGGVQRRSVHQDVSALGDGRGERVSVPNSLDHPRCGDPVPVIGVHCPPTEPKLLRPPFAAGALPLSGARRPPQRTC